MDLEGIVAASAWAIIPLAALGSLLHFAYDWSGHQRFWAVLGAVNESYWEHVKIAVWPVLLAQSVFFALGGWRIPSFVPAAAVALYVIPVTMIGIVYLYKAVTKRNLLGLDIAVFVVAVAVAQLTFILVLTELDASALTIALSGAFLAGLVAAFLVFTLRPPAEPDVFVDPLTSRYGLEAHTEPPESRTASTANTARTPSTADTAQPDRGARPDSP